MIIVNINVWAEDVYSYHNKGQEDGTGVDLWRWLAFGSVGLSLRESKPPKKAVAAPAWPAHQPLATEERLEAEALRRCEAVQPGLVWQCPRLPLGLGERGAGTRHTLIVVQTSAQ